MTDLKFEQKRSLSRVEAADQLAALADALRKGGDAELELGAGTLSLRIPDELRGELEFEVDDGEVELEIEFTWSTARGSTPAATGDPTSKATRSPAPKAARDSAPKAARDSAKATAKAPTDGTAKTATKASRGRKRAAAKPA
ncbi:amphi-Trp domain-containing protein [Streptomyces sp. NPDC059071]|uniref:amphi-Trp domain-containing protein n=1 Tax=unclassified Streptomyces TaxID=2593676 RepID=UPI00364E92E6